MNTFDSESVIVTYELSKRPSRQPDFEAENSALVSIASAMAGGPDNILQKLADVTLELCRAHSTGLSILDDARRSFRWLAIAGQWACHIGGGTPREFGPCGTVLDRKASLLFSRPERYFTYLSEVTPCIEEGLLVPFFVKGEPIGTIWAIAHDQTRQFDAEDKRVLESLGKFASAAYERLQSMYVLERTGRRKDELLAMLSHELRDPLGAIYSSLRLLDLTSGGASTAQSTLDMVELQIARVVRLADDLLDIRFLKEGEVNLRTKDAILVTDERGTILEFNEKFIEMWDIPPEIMESKQHSRVRAVMDRRLRDSAKCAAAVRDIYSSWPAETFHVLELEDNRLIERLSTIEPGGRTTRRVWRYRDITERSRIERALRDVEYHTDVENRLRLFIDTAPAMLATALPDGTVDYINQRWVEYCGLALEEMKGWKWKDTIHPDDESRYAEAWLKAVNSGTPLQIECRVRRADGIYRWLVVRCTALSDAQGKITKWYIAGHDITEQHETQAELQQALNEVKRLKEILYRENLALKADIEQSLMFDDIVGKSYALQAVLTRLSKVAPSDSTVLITGETGTGKEQIARTIHKLSNRHAGPFVSVNCAALAPSLVLSELFGHEKGAFTSADQRRLGRFELAEGGTIFLDEIGELPDETQLAMLRVLQEREFERVGGRETIRADVRVIAASNKDLNVAVETGSFRSDLFYRLNVVPIEVPPLRQRKEDIPLLVHHFIDQFAKRTGAKKPHVSKKTMQLLQSYAWPGNVRELQNVIERSLILYGSEEFEIDPKWLPTRKSFQPRFSRFDEEKMTHEKAIIETALAQSNGQVSGRSGAAAKLGIPASTLESRIKALNIDKQRFRRRGPDSRKLVKRA